MKMNRTPPHRRSRAEPAPVQTGAGIQVGGRVRPFRREPTLERPYVSWGAVDRPPGGPYNAREGSATL